MRTLYDSITAGDIPPGSELVGGYIDGLYEWSAEDWLLFPDRVKVRIAVRAATDDGHVLDVETGAAFPTDAPAWARMRRARGVEPSVYVNLSNVAAVRAAFDAAGEPQPNYWLADYRNDPTLPAGFVAKQYANALFTGGHYDASVVADYWPGVDPPSGEKDVTGDQVKDLIREMLGSPEGAALVKAAIAAPGGYGEALESELNMRESRTVVETLLQVQDSALKPRP